MTGTNGGAGRRDFNLRNAPFVLSVCSMGRCQRLDEKQVGRDERSRDW